jgi:hypothetical protein
VVSSEEQKQLVEYRPLNSSQREIRLLTLSPLSKTKAADEKNLVCCDIEHYPFIRKNPLVAHTTPRFPWGDYAALSYVWGEPTPVKEIIVNGQRVAVRSNLEIALRIISQGPEVENGMKLWVDALCINQSDFEERASQAKRMGEIFESARLVLAWLGPESDDSNVAIDFVRNLRKDEDVLKEI